MVPRPSALRPRRARTTSTAPASGPRDRFGTVWLCRPGERSNPCLANLTTTAVAASGATKVEHAAPAADPPVDCFYVYPTISGQPTVNANLTVGLREEEVATAQASRFSQTCRVYAPVYRQITLAALEHPARITRADALLAYRSVRSAFHDYLAHYNHGRGIVFIGHSQGATILIRLLKQEVDPQPSLRRRLVSALLLGGNVTVGKNRTTGGDFAHIPACTSSRQTGCVVAYSSFTTRPPGTASSDARAPTPASACSPLAALPRTCRSCASTPPPSTAGQAPSSRTSRPRPRVHRQPLQRRHPGSRSPAATAPAARPPGTPAGSRSPTPRSADQRPLLTRFQQPILGLHILDLNIALGNLVKLVTGQAASYQSGEAHLVWEPRGEVGTPTRRPLRRRGEGRFSGREVMEEQDRHREHHDQAEHQVNVFAGVHLAGDSSNRLDWFGGRAGPDQSVGRLVP